MSIVVWPPQGADWIAKIRESAGGGEVIAPANEAEAKTAAADAHFWIGKITPDLLAAAPKLRAVQWDNVSLEGLLFPEMAKSDVVLMNMRHLWDDHISNHILAFFYALCRDFPRLIRRQTEGTWTARTQVAPNIRDPGSMTVLIMGLGGIGAETARRLAVTGPTIIGVDPIVETPPPGVNELAKPERLAELLPRAHAVIICAPQTPETIGLFDEEMLRKMRPDAFLINIGRGKIVKLAALERALAEGWIGGAGIDVFETEPLPASSPLWKMENVIVTPHVAGTANPYASERRLAIVVENLRRFIAGEPLLNVIDKQRWR